MLPCDGLDRRGSRINQKGVVAMAVNATPALVEAPVQCCHRWVIERASGPVSNGVCRKCGAVREFVNTPVSSEWELEALAEEDEGDWEDILKLRQVVSRVA